LLPANIDARLDGLGETPACCDDNAGVANCSRDTILSARVSKLVQLPALMRKMLVERTWNLNYAVRPVVHR
jgi:hypothetical protein